MQSLDEEKQKNAISAAIMSIYDGNLALEVRAAFFDVMNGIMNVILFPLTTTQLGVFNNFLNMKKLDVLRADDSRAEEFRDNFLALFVQEHPTEIIELNEATPHFGELLKQPIMDQDAWTIEYEKWKNRPKMIEKQRALRNLFHENSEPLPELSPNILHTVLLNNPRLIAGTTHIFNLLGSVGATISVFSEITDSNSGFRAGNLTAIASVIATSIGGVGAIKGTYDLAKVLGQKLWKANRSPGTTKFYVNRQSEELAEDFGQGLATEYAVNLNNMERASSRLARMSKAATLGRIFTALGVVADGIFFGLSVNDLVQDFNASSRDPWKIADDFALAASAGVGAVLGKLSGDK